MPVVIPNCLSHFQLNATSSIDHKYSHLCHTRTLSMPFLSRAIQPIIRTTKQDLRRGRICAHRRQLLDGRLGGWLHANGDADRRRYAALQSRSAAGTGPSGRPVDPTERAGRQADQVAAHDRGECQLRAYWAKCKYIEFLRPSTVLCVNGMCVWFIFVHQPSHQFYKTCYRFHYHDDPALFGLWLKKRTYSIVCKWSAALNVWACWIFVSACFFFLGRTVCSRMSNECRRAVRLCVFGCVPVNLWWWPLLRGSSVIGEARIFG